MLKRASGLQLIRVNDDQFVLKLGVQEVLLGGPSAVSILERLILMLDGERTESQVVEAFPGPLREDVIQLITLLQSRGMAANGVKGETLAASDRLQASFYANFGPIAKGAQAALQSATVHIFGVNLIARSLVRGLVEAGVGHVTVVDHPGLDNHLSPHAWLIDADEAVTGINGKGTFAILRRQLSTEEAERSSLLCATSDFGLADALLDVNRLALHATTRFLPAWVSEMTGFIGPLNYPFETACHRCYRLRSASNDPRHAVSGVVNAHMTNNPEARGSIGFLPPMAAIVGEITAMEIVKCLGGFAPSDAVGRLIEVNLVSFQSSVRRVLKIPRCPDCGEAMRHGLRTVTVGPQIVH